MPEGLDSKLVKKSLIQYSGAKDWPIDAFLYLPQNFDPQKKYPAIVWVHGGPARQMRGSWPPSATYALFYAFNQLLTSRGYVVLSPNFRGGIGYGRKFKHGLWKVKGQDDTIDIVNAGKKLKTLDMSMKTRSQFMASVMSYMTLHSLTQ
jgi:dipeptidyl aminopeptidase/acylaminoacyl peptidase